MGQERVLGYLDVQGGGFRAPRYTLVATDRRLIIAQRTRAVEAATGGGGGLGRLFGGKPKVPVGQHYRAMAAEAIVAETPGNVVVTAADLQVAEAIYHEDFDQDGPPTRWVLVHLAARDRDWQLFTVGEAPKLDAVQALLRPALGTTLRG